MWAALIVLALVLGAPAAADAKMPSACAFLAAQINPAAGPAFIASYPTVESGPLRGVAYLYDNAAAAIAMIGCGEIDRARVIGDAILWAQEHDRAWHDGRLRNGYAAGRVADDPVKLAGWWDKGQERWLEDGYQAGTDTGNMAWAMLALLALDRAIPGGDVRYRKGAVRLGEWSLTRRNDDGPGGYTGGYYGWEGDQRPQSWKSTEHNTDLAAAFTLLAAATKDSAWAGHAAEAAQFVKAMWFDACACFATGTMPDGVTPNRVVALDAQIWPLLAIPGLAESEYTASLATSESRLRDHRESKPRQGFTYSDAGGGMWTEGTAQVALATGLLGRTEETVVLLEVVATQRTSDGAYYATDVPELPTGFGDPTQPSVQRFYYHLPHLAAAAWTALAETGFNPFTAAPSLPKPEPAPTQ